jgi:hypothetical protein
MSLSLNSPFKISNYLSDFYEAYHEMCAIGGYQNSTTVNSLKSVITRWRMRGLVERERH